MTYNGWLKDRVLLGFLASMAVIAGLAFGTWTVSNNVAEATRWIAHTHDLLSSLAETEAHALRIELTTQNYRLTGDTSLLTERDATIASREVLLERIRRLSADNPLQQARWAQLRAVIDERLSIARKIESITRDEGTAAAARYVAGAPLAATRERMYRVLREMEQEELRLLGLRTADEALANRRVFLAEAAASGALGVLLVVNYLAIRRQGRQAEASRRALANSEERLAITLRSIGDGVLATDTEGRIIHMNPVAERLTGWPFEQARGLPVEQVFHIVHEDSRELVRTPIARVLASGGIHELAEHTSLLSRDGTEHAIADSAAPIRDASGDVIGVVLVFRDEGAARQARRLIRQQNALLEERVQERTAELQESQAHLHSVIDNVPALIAFVDAQQRYVYTNRPHLDRFAPGSATMTGRSVAEVMGAQRYAIIEPLITRVLSGEALSYDWQPFPDTWLQVNYVPRFSPGREVLGYYVLGTDVTQRKQSEQEIGKLNDELGRHVNELEHLGRALRTLSAVNRSMLRAADEPDLLDGMCRGIVAAGGYRLACVWYRQQDHHGALVPAAQQGYPGGMAALRQVIALGDGGNPDASTAVASATRTGQTRIVRNIGDDPAYAPWRQNMSGYGCCIAIPLRIGGHVAGALAIYSANIDDFSADEATLLGECADDMAFGITAIRTRDEEARIREQMHQLTYFDPVTGLPNEARFTQLAAMAIDAAEPGGPGLAAVQVRLDRLRDINEALGLRHGDDLLRQFGQRLQSMLPAGASAARLRGDEFAMLLPGSGVTDAVLLARQMQALLATPFLIAELPVEVAARMGITHFPQHAQTVHDLLRQMDVAVGRAREQKLRHAVYEPSHDQGQGQAARLVMVGQLRHAIDAGELVLYLQPKVDMRSRRLCGAEGLVRWRHPQRGLVSPAEFIGLAERTELIRPLTEWMIAAAVGFNAGPLQPGAGIPVAINLSASNLQDASLLGSIHDLQVAFGLAPGLLEIELTESVLMEDAEHALHILGALRARNITLYIDDFGTGYSSLSYLQKLPVDCIKIDQSFVARMLMDNDSAVIVRSTIDLAHDLGRKVVAEGVESQAQWDRLAAFGCDMAQGYFIAAPMPSEQFRTWAANWDERRGSGAWS